MECDKVVVLKNSTHVRLAPIGACCLKSALMLQGPLPQLFKSGVKCSKYACPANKKDNVLYYASPDPDTFSGHS